jgi:gliding motility-associated-like protein
LLISFSIPGAKTIMKIDRHGLFVWCKIFSQRSFYDNGLPLSIAKTSTNLYIGTPLITDTTSTFSIFKTDLNGTLLSQKSYQLNHSIIREDSLFFDTWANSLSVYKNKLIANMTNAGNHKSEAILQIDNSLNMIRGDEIFPNSSISFNNISLTSNNSGKNVFSVSNNSGSYYALFDNALNISVQRKISYALPVNTTEFNFKDNGILNAVAALQPTDSINFLITDTDPSYLVNEGCTGQDTNFVHSAPLIFRPSPLIIDTVKFDPSYINIVPENYTLTDYPFTSTPFCKQGSTCDSIKIKGQTDFCINDDSAIFTASKNIACIKNTEWFANTNALSFSSKTNDTAALVSFNAAGKNYIYAMIPGCGIVDSLLINVRAKQIVALGNDTTLCKGNIYTLHAGDNFLKYHWQDNSSDSVFTVTENGKYYVTATDSCNNISSDSIYIVYSDLSLNIGNDFMLCKGTDTSLSASNGFTNYQWQPAFAVDNTASQTVQIHPTTNIRFIVSAVAYPDCVYKDSVLATVINCPNTFYMPTGFTPNNDGLNDNIHPLITGKIKSFEFFIYNRLGQMIFKSNNAEIGWNGAVDGMPQNTGSYVWFCNYQFIGAPMQAKKGTLTLIR